MVGCLVKNLACTGLVRAVKRSCGPRIIANLLLFQTVVQTGLIKQEIKRQHRARHVFFAHDACARPITADLICLHLHPEKFTAGLTTNKING